MRAFLASSALLASLILALPIALICLPFWIIAFLTRYLAGLFEPRSISWQEVIEFNPIVGWKPKPNLDAYCSFAAGTFHVKTDSEGWPGQSTLKQSQIVVFGDSYAFGYGVNARASFSDINSNVRIKAIGAPGYNMVQELIWMDRLSSQLRHKLVVWFIYFGNDLYDNLLPNLYHYRMPFVRNINGTDHWQIVTQHIKEARWHFSAEHNFRREEKWAGTFGANGLSNRVYSACEFLLKTGHDICSQADARLVVMTIPWSVQLNQAEWKTTLARIRVPQSLDPNLPDRKIMESCQRLGIPLVSGRGFLDENDYIAVEGHWNERGHQRVAAMLSRLYEQNVQGKNLSIEADLVFGPAFASRKDAAIQQPS